MESIFEASLYGFIAFVLVGYSLSRIFKRNDVADVLWGLGFILITAINLNSVETIGFRTKLMVSLLLLWSLRLSLYLGFRSFRKTEDIRYLKWRLEWGDREPLMAFLKVFVLQGLVMLIVSFPLAAIIHDSDRALGPLDFAATMITLLGIAIESVADWELASFKNNTINKGRILTSGLWGLCRHPNYFGEALVWWGFGLLALGTAFGAWTLASPILITYLLMKVSGVPMLERRMRAENSDFEKYVRNTPAMIPWTLHQFSTFVAIICALVFLDFLWLGLLMNEYYKDQAQTLLRVSGGQWDVLLWPAVGVYFFLAMAIQKFAVSGTSVQSVFRGFLLGMCIYGVYDLTNLALLNGWPIQRSLVDMVWGSFLCATSAWVGFWGTTILTKNKVGK